MSVQLVITKWNGETHIAVDFLRDTQSPITLGTQTRINLNDREATMHLDLLRLRYRDTFIAAERGA